MSLLSIVVSFHHNDAHLGPCLESLARQSLGAAEVLLAGVGDGGTQRGGEPGEEEGEEDLVSGRAHALHTARSWDGAEVEGKTFTLLGASAATPAGARAAAADHAGGELLAMVDGRDTLPRYALDYLMGAMASGVDLALGGVYRFNELGTRPSAEHRAVASRERRSTHIGRFPTLARDRLLGNRIMRRALWESAAAHWDLRDGGQDLAVPAAHFAAEAVHVLPAPVYLLRDGAPAPQPFRESAAAARLSSLSEFANGLSGPQRALWDAEALRFDLWKILMSLDDADEGSQSRILTDAAAYLDQADPGALRQCPPLRRLAYHLVRRQDVERLLELITFAKSVEPAKAPVVRRGLTYYLRLPFFDDAEARVPREVYRAGDALTLRQKTEAVQWREGTLVLAGRVGVQRMPARRRWQQRLRAHLVEADTGERRRLAVTVRRAAEYHLPDVPEAARHDFGGFEIRIPQAALRGRQGGGARWKVELSIFARGITRRHTLRNPVAGAPRRPSYRPVGTDTAGRELWARPDWDEEGELTIAVQPVLAKLTRFGHADSQDGDALELAGEAHLGGDGEYELVLVRRPGTAELRLPTRIASGRFHGRVSVADLLQRAVSEGDGLLRQERWDVALCAAAPGSAGVPVVLPDEVEPQRRSVRGDTEREVAVERTATGHARLRAGWARPAIEEAHWDGRQLVLAGRHPGRGELSLVVKAQGRSEEHPVGCERDGEHFRAVFAPGEIATHSGPVSLAAGTYEFWGRLHRVGGGETGTDTRAELSPELLAGLPLELATEERTYTLTALDTGRPVLRVGSDLHPQERGTYAQRVLREQTYPSLRREPLREQILFDSYTGRQCSDSPYGIYAELRRRGGPWRDYPMNWLVDDGQVVPPHDTGRVRRRGREYYESLARSRYLVTNSRQPAWFAKRSGQVVVQTWHGSMLKRIGFDIENIKGKTRDYHRKLAWESRQWDYLISPSPWATPILRRAFRFEGEILETGYPRNDIFFSAEREQIAAATRKRLGLPEDRKVILYAPTWRDDKYYTRGKHKLDLHLDLQHMYEALGEEYVLLVRPHPRVVDRVPTAGRGFVHDVSRYPEIMELFLITDVLVTDYSSMMFDFANTGRPMLFFTYDLESYRDQLRGFYFDFEQTAPGPLLTESGQVVEAVADLDTVRRDYAAPYERFVGQFCPLDDGGAAARIVDQVFAPS